MSNFINDFNASKQWPDVANNKNINDVNNVNDEKQVKTLADSNIFNPGTPKIGQILDKGSSFFNSLSNNYQMQRNESMRREIEERNQNPQIEDELIDAFQQMGKGAASAVNAMKTFFGKKEQKQEEKEDKNLFTNPENSEGSSSKLFGNNS